MMVASPRSGGVDSAMRVSLSKIRLHGSVETLNTKEAAKKAVGAKPRIIRIGGTSMTTKMATPMRESEDNSTGGFSRPSPLISLRSAKDLIGSKFAI